MKKITRTKLAIKKYLKEGIEIVIGCLLMALGTALFLLPNQLSSGGFAGISTIIYYLLGTPLGLTMLALNIPLIILTIIKVGKEIAVKGILGTIVLSTFIDIFEKIEPLTEDRLLASIYGGILIGLGTAIVLKANASTGGTDLLSYIIRAFKPHFKTSNLIVIVDTTIVILNVLFFKEIEIGLYSAIAIYLMGKMIDIVFEGVYFTKTMFIVSNKYREIAQEIGQKLDRGSTAIYAKGTYTREKKMVLWCVASRGEVVRIKQIAQEIDPRAFIVISNAREAWGKGFK
jgi:uncharacterized membrane-anchored protein YitT (DUF2179 family)